MSAEVKVELSCPLLLKMGPEKNRLLCQIIKLSDCLLVVEVGDWQEGSCINRNRRMLKKFIREGGLDGFDYASGKDRRVLAKVWKSIRHLGGDETGDLLTNYLEGEKEGVDQIVQPQKQATDQVQVSFIEQCGQEGGRSQNQNSHLG